MTVRLLPIAVLLALVLAACGDEDAPGASAESPDTEPATTQPEDDDTTEDATEDDMTEDATGDATDDDMAGDDDAVMVAVASTDLGDVLVDGEGMTLYLFDSDEGGESTCYGDCAGNWPPLLGEAHAGEGAQADLLGVTERDDGELQVTYAGHPLYYFAGDSEPGDANGQGVGDIWWVLDASGTAMRETASADTGEPRYDY